MLSSIILDHLASSRNNYEPSTSSDKPKEKKFYVSDMGKCQRMRWLKRKGISTEFGGHVYWTFQIGNLYHDWVYSVLESKGILIETEDYVIHPHFSGRYDAIIQLPEDDKQHRAVLDIKSAGAWKFKKILDGGEDPEYIAQVLTYQMLLQDSGRKDLDRSTILYVNKEPKDNIPSFHEMDFHLTKTREKALRGEMDTLVEFWVEDRVPPCTCPAWMKNYNSFLPFCSATKDRVEDAVKLIKDGNKLISTHDAVFLETGEGEDLKRTQIKI